MKYYDIPICNRVYVVFTYNNGIMMHMIAALISYYDAQ